MQRLQTLGRKNKIARLVWGGVWLFLYRPSPRLFHAWRCFLLRSFGASISKGVHPYPTSRIWAPWNLEMSEGSSLGDYVDCYCVDKIRIGKYTTISQYSYLCSATHDYTLKAMPLVTAPITIGDYAWITADVFIGPGVSIGDGAVIGARTTIFKDVPPWVVVAGNPAKVIKRRVIR